MMPSQELGLGLGRGRIREGELLKRSIETTSSSSSYSSSLGSALAISAAPSRRASPHEREASNADHRTDPRSKSRNIDSDMNHGWALAIDQKSQKWYYYNRCCAIQEWWPASTGNLFAFR